MAAFLVPVGEGRPILLDKAIVLIGRQPDCDAVLTDSRKVSRRHCCIAKVDKTYMLRDLGSMNGVWVNGERVEGESRVDFGDVISIGDVEFVLEERAGTSGRRPPNSPQRRAEDAPSSEPPSAEPSELSQELPVAIPEPDEGFRSADRGPEEPNDAGSAEKPPEDLGSEDDDVRPLEGGSAAEFNDSDELQGSGSHYGLTP